MIAGPEPSYSVGFMNIGLPLKILAAVSLVLVMLVAAASPAMTPSASGGDGVVVARYNQMRTGVATDVGHITQPTILWSFKTNGTIATSPLAADVNGDGNLEVFLGEYMPGGASDGSRHAYVLDAHGNALYTIPMRYNGVAAAAAELDGDPGMEIVFSMASHSDEAGGLGYRVFNGEDGSPVWSFDTSNSPGEGFFASPALLDVNGDGGLDLIAGAMDDTVYALRGVDGTPLWQSPALGHYVRHATPMADVNGDGRMDVTVQTEAGDAFLFDALTGAEEWRTDLGMIVAATPAIGDLDGDGSLEIVYSLVVDGGVVAVHGDGTILWRQTVHDASYRSPTLVDVDGDGILDVVEGDSDDPAITAYRGTDGTILWDTKLVGPWASGALVTADIDGDGAMEILAGTDHGLTVLSASTGAIEWEFALPGTIRGEPLVRDIDGRGGAEILVGAGDGTLYALGVVCGGDGHDHDGDDDHDGEGSDDHDHDHDGRDDDDGHDHDGRDDDDGHDHDGRDDDGGHDHDGGDDCGGHDHEGGDDDGHGGHDDDAGHDHDGGDDHGGHDDGEDGDG